jgi:hypothetical protein
MQRGYLRDEILSSSAALVVDVNYYLHQQILPVVSRLLEPFDGTDQALLAQCLGLDSSKYKQRQGKSHTIKDEDDIDDNTLDEPFNHQSQSFKHCDPFVFPCVQCQTLNFWNTPFVFNEVSYDPDISCIDYTDFVRSRIKRAVHRYCIVQTRYVRVNHWIITCLCVIV